MLEGLAGMGPLTPELHSSGEPERGQVPGGSTSSASTCSQAGASQQACRSAWQMHLSLSSSSYHACFQTHWHAMAGNLAV